MPDDPDAVADPPKKKRDRTIIPASWWTEEIESLVLTGRGKPAADDKRMPQVELNEEIRKRFGEKEGDYLPQEVSKCISGEVTQIKLARQMSDVLKAPPPAFVPQTREQAVAMLIAERYPVEVLMWAVSKGVAPIVAAPDHTGGAKPPRTTAEVPRASRGAAERARASSTKKAILDVLKKKKLRAAATRSHQTRRVDSPHGAAHSPRGIGGDEEQHQGARPRGSGRRGA